VGGLVYNVLLFAGSVIGLLLIDKLSRRTFLIATFYLAALGLAVLAYAKFGPVGTMLAFGVFACILSAAANLEFVYPPELFPTHLRASGVGLAVASSRFGAYFAEAGHAFRLKPDRCFARSWTAGAQRRRGFCFYSDCWFSVKLIFSFRIDSPFMLIR
jgi:hypothetical protein